jgi:aspartate-semialdehyde dehydrogenase
LFASRAQTLTRKGKLYPVLPADELERPDALQGDLAFVALDDAHSARYVPRLLALGNRVVDKSSVYRSDKAVPLIVAGVNCELATKNIRLVANPNCTTIPLAMCMSVMHRKWGVEDAIVSTYQAVSGAGKDALAAFLGNAAKAYAQMAETGEITGESLDLGDYVGNTVPHNGRTDSSGISAEEWKLMNETKRILDAPALAISVQCCRVPVAIGHYENVWLRIGENVPVAAIEQQFASAASRWIRLVPGAEGAGLTALAAVHHRDEALVGRIRKDPRDAQGRTICLTVAADNIRCGAATNAVRIAERWFPPVAR